MKGKKKKIVIAEDDKFISEIYVTKLNAEGYEIEYAEDGKEALEKIKEVKPHIILLDILMPKLDGLEVLKRIRANEEFKDTSVIVLTNVNEKDKADKAMKMGADGYLVKSNFTPDEVVKKIKESQD